MTDKPPARHVPVTVQIPWYSSCLLQVSLSISLSLSLSPSVSLSFCPCLSPFLSLWLCLSFPLPIALSLPVSLVLFVCVYMCVSVKIWSLQGLTSHSHQWEGVTQERSLSSRLKRQVLQMQRMNNWFLGIWVRGVGRPVSRTTTIANE